MKSMEISAIVALADTAFGVLLMVTLIVLAYYYHGKIKQLKQ